MPKERIYGAIVPFIDEDPARTVVDLSWSRDGSYVQLATIAIDASTGDPLNIVEKFGLVSDSEDECPSISGGMYLQLDRYGINKLIRYLRRARDQAYGKDE